MDDTKQIRILLIEDNSGDARLMREALAGVRDVSFEVEWVERLWLGMKRLAEGGIDVVLLDLALPDSQGLDTLVRVQTEAPEVPIVVLTGLDEKALAVEAMQKGAQDFLGKGYVQENSNVLARSIRYAIERKRVEEKLRETNQTLRTVIQASPMPIMALDPDGNVKMWNLAAERTFGWTEEEVRGRPLPIVAAEKQEEFRALRQIVLQGQELTGVEVRRQKKDGSPIDVSLSVAPLRDTRGRVVGVIVVVTDATPRKQVERLKDEADHPLPNRSP